MWKQKALRLAHIRPTLPTNQSESLGPIHLSPLILLGVGRRGGGSAYYWVVMCKHVGDKERKQEFVELPPLLLGALTGATAVIRKTIFKGGTMSGNPSFQKEPNPAELHHVARGPRTSQATSESDLSSSLLSSLCWVILWGHQTHGQRPAPGLMTIPMTGEQPQGQ